MENNKYNSIVIDFETADNKPTAAPLSIGITPFNKGELQSFDALLTAKASLYIKLDMSDVRRYEGLTSSEGTQKWWEEQGEEAKHVLQPSKDDVTLVDALKIINDHLEKWCLPIVKNGLSIYCRGYDFDGGILKNLYKITGVESPLKAYNRFRCIRTAIDELANANCGYLADRPDPDGFVKHHALHDCANDAVDLTALQYRNNKAITMYLLQGKVKKIKKSKVESNDSDGALTVTKGELIERIELYEKYTDENGYSFSSECRMIGVSSFCRDIAKKSGQHELLDLALDRIGIHLKILDCMSAIREFQDFAEFHHYSERALAAKELCVELFYRKCRYTINMGVFIDQVEASKDLLGGEVYRRLKKYASTDASLYRVYQGVKSNLSNSDQENNLNLRDIDRVVEEEIKEVHRKAYLYIARMCEKSVRGGGFGDNANEIALKLKGIVIPLYREKAKEILTKALEANYVTSERCDWLGVSLIVHDCKVRDVTTMIFSENSLILAGDTSESGAHGILHMLTGARGICLDYPETYLDLLLGEFSFIWEHELSKLYPEFADSFDSKDRFYFEIVTEASRNGSSSSVAVILPEIYNFELV